MVGHAHHISLSMQAGSVWGQCGVSVELRVRVRPYVGHLPRLGGKPGVMMDCSLGGLRAGVRVDVDLSTMVKSLVHHGEESL